MDHTFYILRRREIPNYPSDRRGVLRVAEFCQLRGHNIIFVIWQFVSFYVLMIFIFVFCYWRILFVVRRQARVMASHSAAGSSAAQVQSNQIQTNVIKTIVLVSALYTISWKPLYICAVILYLYPHPIEWQGMYYSTTFIAFSYMCTNPFVYATKFDPVKQVLLRMIPCKKTNQGNAGSVGAGT